ncbi:MAG: hypothetical protein KGN00_01305 [Chloroflexota bacterium]|nr:hypothetical protein [Chloroflexota bacterium]MDE3192299.1 hypothetical protein [Chloroflexota bacterium]
MGTSTTTRPAAARARGGCLSDELCAEHKELARQLELFDAVAEKTEAASTTVLRREVDRAYVLLSERLLPHARAEHELRTRLASRDHRHIREAEDRREVERLTARLAERRAALARIGDAATRREIRHLLYEIHALTRLHFADELLSHRDDEGR